MELKNLQIPESAGVPTKLGAWCGVIRFVLAGATKKSGKF